MLMWYSVYLNEEKDTFALNLSESNRPQFSKGYSHSQEFFFSNKIDFDMLVFYLDLIT